MGWFALHPPLQSLAISAFLLGITPLQPSPKTTEIRKNRFATHQVVMLGLVLPALAVGTAAMWWNKHAHGAVHFASWHGKFGLATVVWVVSRLFSSRTVLFFLAFLPFPAFLPILLFLLVWPLQAFLAPFFFSRSVLYGGSDVFRYSLFAVWIRFAFG